ncbi:Glycosyl transferase, group 2 family protein [Pseudomonas syringae pv. cerasicola]|uniref:Glycosyl transferase, group 2 family protein n=2 Tax=Pseudomonas syringae group TaxID=136849 RepID=A0A0P9LML4_PSESX|nr:Glycosyl transferase, group 2 family protein [Pseudomonas syringae pv. cerasicola]RMS75166.1 Glycosyl transferase, group 2 protein [Pseudomonas savastanoi]RMT52544.1 Glycosyl transferase, group 2 protein [Pseudomonas savastanoi]SOS22671.1 glycosyl transferase [Pseudomonas syringae pv. cerasicola]SPF13492.1 glycosyl transferase [Pseudomonas syringae pv. cerasicola]
MMCRFQATCYGYPVSDPVRADNDYGYYPMMPSESQSLTPQPLVSIVAPCYNAERFLEAALQSIFAQDYGNFEVIIVDDGSTDNSIAMLESLQARYPFQLYRQANQGVSAALNHGLRHAKGVYLSTPDLDDIMLPFSLRIRAQYLDEHPEVGCVGALISYMDCDGNTIKCQSRDYIERLTFDDVLRGAVVVGAPVALYRMQAMRDANGYDPEIKVQDFQATLRIARLGYEMHVIPEVVTRYRRHPNNLSRKYKVLLEADLKSIEPYREHPEYQSGRTQVVNKALKYAAVADKRYAWSLLRTIPWKYFNGTTWRRCKRLLLSYR